MKWLIKHGNRRRPGKPLAAGTVSKRIGQARQFFRIALRKKWITENPFIDQTIADEVNKERQVFVTRETIAKVMKQMTDNQWKLVLALSRFQGLRCPSEIQSLRWEWIDWAQQRMKIFSPKSKRYQHKKWRVMPIFPETLPYLQQQFEDAEPKAQLVIDYPNRTETAFGNTIRRYIQRAQVKPWPKLTQNLRSSLETELVERFPIHVVTEWLGNSPRIAAKHYLQVTEDHFRTATGGGEVKSEVMRSKMRSNQM